MERTKQLDIFNNIERKVNFNIHLLKVAKDFCEFNFDKANEISTLFTILEIALAKQKEIASNFDNICLETKLN